MERNLDGLFKKNGGGGRRLDGLEMEIRDPLGQKNNKNSVCAVGLFLQHFRISCCMGNGGLSLIGEGV